MIAKKRIGVLMGGMSTEREISLKSGLRIADALDRLGYDVVALDVQRNIAEVLVKERVEAAFIALHGRYGEDGAIQGLLEILGIPYTGSGISASAIGMDKGITKKLLVQGGIPTPDFVLLKKDPVAGDPIEGLRGKPFPLPWVVKPTSQGSTIGISIVHRLEEVQGAMEAAFDLDATVLVESYIEGQEITAGVLDHAPLPLVEIVPKESFYDYRAKTTMGMAEYLTPARLDGETDRQIRSLAQAVHFLAGCRGATRVDFRVDRKNRPYVLEINTVPGMTETSLLPRAARAAGIEYDELVERILLSAFQERARDGKAAR